MSDDATCLACGSTRNVPLEQRQADLIAELRRQLDAQVRQVDRLRAATIQPATGDENGERDE